ncbi:hypothetical protein QL285_082027 [Trifolium repens]|nr:hypothetical protein QL285_082027 [Trifolium repens]
MSRLSCWGAWVNYFTGLVLLFELLLISAVPTNTIITARSGESLSFLSLAATRATHNNRPKREGCLHCGGSYWENNV